MAEVKWIKIVTDIFDDEKILLIEQLPDGYAIIVAWFKLLCLAGKQNNSGVFLMNNKIPYTDDMLAIIFRMKKSTVQMALEIFRQYGMIEIVDNIITIPNWGKHQTLDQLENKKGYMRNYMRDYREKQKNLITSKTNSKTNSKVNVSALDIEEDIDKELDIDNIIESKDSMSVNTDVEVGVSNNVFDEIMNFWNKNCLLKNIKTMTPKRKGAINARIKEHGIKNVYYMIELVNKSPFLQGQSKQGWTADFDWCFRPTNFLKIIEGKYLPSVGGKLENKFKQVMQELEGIE